MINIQIIDPIYSKCNKEAIPILKQVLCYKSIYWRQGRYKKEQHEYMKPLISKDGYFLTGFLPYIGLKYNGGVVARDSEEMGGKVTKYLPKTRVNYPIPLRDYQEQAISSMLYWKRGIILLPTGSGKTLTFLSFLLHYPEARTLIIAHTQDLLKQTYDRAKEMFPGEVGMWGGGVKDSNRITIATIQTLNKMWHMSYSELHDDTDILIVDECHHFQHFDGAYSKFFYQCPAPFRFGFTATLPRTEEGLMCIKGHMGEVIYQKSQIELSESKILAKVKIRQRMIPPTNVTDIRKYQDIYDRCIINNRTRHRIILEEANNFVVKEKGIVLILVTRIDHGNQLYFLAQKLFPAMRTEFIWGQTEMETRSSLKEAFNKKEIDCVISTVFGEGVDIPNLSHIINASGGKSEIKTIQNIGRGLRKPPGKEFVILLDFFDKSNPYLISHYGQRISTYFQEGWIE